jgi:hypothetical protein
MQMYSRVMHAEFDNHNDPSMFTHINEGCSNLIGRSSDFKRMAKRGDINLTICVFTCPSLDCSSSESDSFAGQRFLQ